MNKVNYYLGEVGLARQRVMTAMIVYGFKRLNSEYFHYMNHDQLSQKDLEYVLECFEEEIFHNNRYDILEDNFIFSLMEVFKNEEITFLQENKKSIFLEISKLDQEMRDIFKKPLRERNNPTRLKLYKLQLDQLEVLAKEF